LSSNWEDVMRMGPLIAVLVWLSATPSTVRAQQPPDSPATDETTAIMTAAAAQARTALPPGTLMIDVDDGTTTAGVRARAVAASLGVKAGKATIDCGAVHGSCRLIGTQSAMKVMPPVVKGAEATVQVQTWDQPADGSRDIHQALLEIKLARTGGVWVAVGGRVRATT
jgi:hypothetical protein